MFENIVIGICVFGIIAGSVCRYLDYITAGAWKR